MYEIVFYVIFLVCFLTLMQLSRCRVDQCKNWLVQEGETATRKEFEDRFNEVGRVSLLVYFGFVFSVASTILVIWAIAAYCSGIPSPGEFL